MQASEVKLGMPVFAKLSGFPWWPAVVSKCPHDNQWIKGEKYWVIFFNDTHGAWLKGSVLRSFDSYNRVLCLEQNNSFHKYPRYRERVEKAVELAEIFVSGTIPSRRVARANLPRREESPTVARNEEGVSVTDDDESSVSNDVVLKHSGKRIQSGKSAMKRKRRNSQSHSRGRGGQDNEDSLDDQNAAADEGGRADGGRPRRKRYRSSRYEEIATALDGRNSERRRIVSSEIAADGQQTESRMKEGLNVTSALKYGQRDMPSVIPSKYVKRKRLQGTLSSEKVGGPANRLRTRASQKVCGATGEQADVETLADTAADKRLRGNCSGRLPTSRRPANERRIGSKGEEEKRAEAAVTREMYISELTNLVGPKALQADKAERYKVPSLRRRVRSRARGSSELEDTSNTGEGTDSEERPERERKVTTGSLEAAAEDLVEYAVRDGRGEKNVSSDRKEDILDMHSVALGGSELVCSILNRISDLERDVMLLQKKAKREEQSTLGEDATAAGVKSAVEALASASAAFAKARDYDTGVISRSLDLLWADGHFPLSGADGELLRTVARSLVLASCKRRREQVVRERHNRKQHRQREVDRTPIRQKADVRDRARKAAGRKASRPDADDESEVLRVSSGRKGKQQRSSQANLSPREQNITYKPENIRDSTPPVIPAEKKATEGSKLTQKITYKPMGKYSRVDVVEEEDTDDTSPNQKITYKPETSKGGVHEVVEEEVLVEERAGEGFDAEELIEAGEMRKEERSQLFESEEIMDGGGTRDSDQ